MPFYGMIAASTRAIAGDRREVEAMTTTYQVAIEQGSILVRMSTDLFSRAEIVRFLDYLEIDKAGWQQLQEQIR